MNNDPEAIAIVICLTLLFSCCAILSMFRPPNSGQHVGYVTAVSDDWDCTRVFIKTDLSTTQEDVYQMRKADESREFFIEAMNSKANIKLDYQAYPVGWCNYDLSGTYNLLQNNHEDN